MRKRLGRCALILIWAAPLSMAQELDPKVEKRLEQMEQKYQSELKLRDEKIARLETQLRGTLVTPAVTQSDVDKVTSDLMKDLDSRNPVTGTRRTPVSFNPDMAVITDFAGTWSNDRSNDAWNRFDIREVELDLRAAVEPRADAVAILAFARDVENPLFGGEQADGPDTSVELEEVYLFLHDFGVPNLTARLGRFHLRFGRQNLLHLHELPTSDPPLVNQAFLAPEALADSGISLSYVLPPSLSWGQYIEAVVEVISGEGGGSESTSLPADLTVDSPAINAHVLWNADISSNWNLEMGASWLWGKRSSDNARDVNIYGLDLTLIHRDPTGRFNNQLLQAEFLYGDLAQLEETARSSAWGAYLLAQQQLNRDWYAGLRIDWTQNPQDSAQEAWAVTPYVSWYWSEFLRFRLMYQHRDGDQDSADVLYFQATWVFGSHPPHPYWSMK